MPTSPWHGEQKLLNEVRRTFANAETETLDVVKRKVNKARLKASSDEEFLALLQRYIREVRQEVNEDVIGKLERFEDRIAEGVEEAYDEGQSSAVNDIEKLGVAVMVGKVLTDRDKDKISSAQTKLVRKISGTYNRIGSQAQSEYKNVINAVSEKVINGDLTRKQAAQQALNKFADRGITGFVDNAGRSWNLSSYTEMATRSTTGQMALEGHVTRLQDNDIDLAMVSDHGEECELCRPWEGKVLSVSGEHKKYPTLSNAIGDGLFHQFGWLLEVTQVEKLCEHKSKWCLLLAG